MDRQKQIRTGSMRGGAQGTRVHPETPEGMSENRAKALQRTFGTTELEMGRATVERGRTVECAVTIDPALTVEEQLSCGQRIFVGYDKEGKTIYGPAYRQFGPGEMVTLPLMEISRLTALGFLVDPDKKYRQPSEAQARHVDEPQARILNSDPRPGPTVIR